MKKTALTKLKASKGNQTALALLLFFALFNLLFIGDIWKYTLQPTGLHTWLDSIFPNWYDKNEYLFYDYTDNGKKNMVFYCWNIFLALTLASLFFISFLLVPKSKSFISTFYPDTQNPLQMIFSPIVGLFVIYAILSVHPPSNRLTMTLYYSGYPSLVIIGFSFSAALCMPLIMLAKNITTIFDTLKIDKKQ